MAKLDLIEHVQTEWVAPVVFAPKDEGIIQLRVDFRHLNAGILRDSYFLPRRNEWKDSLEYACLFYILDANGGTGKLDITYETEKRSHSFLILAYTTFPAFNSTGRMRT